MIEQRKTIFRRFLNGSYTQKEASQVFQYISGLNANELFDDLAAETWEESACEGKVIANHIHEQYKKEARQLLKHLEQKKKKSLNRLYAVAASVAILIAIVWGGFYFQDYMVNSKITYLEVTTSYDERKQLTLPDGTQLVLNSCSYIRYPEHFINNERIVELEGEGYFKVMHDESVPFIINTSKLNVVVLGTSFNVKSYNTDEIVSVSVESGKVQVNVQEAMMRLIANEQIYINTVSEEYSKHKDKRTVAAWIKGSLYFNSTPVRDVCKELERAYNCRITFAPDQRFDNLISGEHDNKDLESVLKAIEYISGIKYRKDGRDILLYK